MNRQSHPPCVIGEFCSRHNFVHGAEANELREKLEKSIDHLSGGSRVFVQRVLDECDARDSLAWLEVEAEHRRLHETESSE